MLMYLLIPLLPFIAFLTIASFGARLKDQGHKIAIPAMGVSLAGCVSALVHVATDGPVTVPLYTLVHSGSLVIDLGFYIDQLTVLLLFLVTGVSTVVHVYSARYMIGDPRYNRFFALISLFTFAMIMLVMSRNLLMLYIFWEVMGICSYLLISHWAERVSSCRAATKAFLVNSVADVGLGFGVILTFATFGTLDIPTILSQAEAVSGNTINLLGWLGLDFSVQTITLIVLFLFMGALGKSAQVPLHVWLPFAMEAPTPVSALIHAATMVNAGPFLLVRMSPLVVLSPAAMTCIAIIGATTALYAAVVSLTQVDIKKILAYSTISQIGFMIMTCGLGAFVVAVFHLVAHGFFKGFLFLSTGNALRALSDHGHVESSPSSSLLSRPALWPLAIGSLVLAFLPPILLFSNSYQQLWTSQNFASAEIAFWVIGLTTVFFTAMYLSRGVLVLFDRGPTVISPSGIMVETSRPQLLSGSHVLGVIVGLVVMGTLLSTLWNWFGPFLTPAVGRALPVSTDSAVGSPLWFLFPFGVACLGWFMAFVDPLQRYGIQIRQSRFAQALYVHFLNRWYFDELYEALIVQPTLRVSRWLWQEVDKKIINGFVMGIASVSLGMAKWLWRVVDLRGIDGLVWGVGRHSVGLAGWLWRVVDLRGIDRVVVGLGERTVGMANWLWRVSTFRVHKQSIQNEGTVTQTPDAALQEFEPRTLQHHLLVMIFWLIVAIGLFYWLAV